MSSRIKNAILWSIMLLLFIGMFLPMWWMVLGTFSESFQPRSLYQNIVEFDFTLKYVEKVFSSADFSRSIFNSVFVSGCVSVGNIVFCLMVGYAFARRRFPFKKILFFSIIVVLMVPLHIILIPLFLEIKFFGMLDTYWALILPFLVNPLGIFLVSQYIRELPADLEEAARIDGASDFGILFKVVAPLCRPVLAVMTVMIFMVNWNAFLLPFILTNSAEMRTLPVAIGNIVGRQVEYQTHFAASFIATIPIIIVFLIFQRRIVSGIVTGALKQ
ncbi:MAG: ABC transporter permease subunit [candidate division Zixibacteria bacterium]|nr:ABC transporter permease subunit [candidate division Zixibacteria bacterium]